MDETQQLKKDVEELKRWKANLERAHSIPLNVFQAFSERFKSKIVFVKSTLNFPEVAGGGNQTLTVGVSGIKPNDPVLVSAINAIATGIFFTGYVTSTGGLTIRCDNFTAGAINPGSAEFNIAILT